MIPEEMDEILGKMIKLPKKQMNERQICFLVY